jgi:hypothetical protein
MGVVMLGVNALARETSLPRQTVSRKMREGATAADIRRYAALRDGRSPAKNLGRPPGELHKKTAVDQGEYEVLVRGQSKLEAIDDAKLRRARALAERGELDNMLRRGELLPVAYVRQWASRYLTDGRDTLLAGPSELQDILASESDPLKVAAILRAWLERVMAKFHQLERLWGDCEDRSPTS